MPKPTRQDYRDVMFAVAKRHFGEALKELFGHAARVHPRGNSRLVIDAFLEGWRERLEWAEAAEARERRLSEQRRIRVKCAA